MVEEFSLLGKFESTFRDGPYRHRNPQLGNRVADFLFDDLYLLDPKSRFRDDVDRGRIALNPKGLSPGLKARRGDGSLGPVVLDTLQNPSRATSSRLRPRPKSILGPRSRSSPKR
jgi:hypothetical protein